MNDKGTIFRLALALGLITVLFSACATPDAAGTGTAPEALEPAPTEDAVPETEPSRQDTRTAVASMLREANEGKSRGAGDRDAPSERVAGLGVTPEFSIWRPIGSIVFILAALFGVNALLKKRGGRLLAGSGKPDSRIQILEKLAVDNARQLMLVSVDGERVLVGSSRDRIDSMTVVGAKKAADSVEMMDDSGEAAG